MEKVTCEPLTEQLSLFVSKEHTFGTDAFLLADFAGEYRAERCCDLGTGCGIIAFLLAAREKAAHITCVDLSADAIFLCNRTVETYPALGQVQPVCADLRKLGGREYAGQFDLVVCNPPYYAEGTGKLSRSKAAQVARHEMECTLADVVETAFRLLRVGGSVCLSFKPERMADLFFELRKARLEPKRLRMVQKNEGSAPWLLLVEARKCGKPFLRVEPPLLLYRPDGTQTEEFQRIYEIPSKGAMQDEPN
ncbi:MAG: methyltransferase domain-containing protein [Ruminococcaceae bacterium]|nr:methyltransferase domain-containing protein [Oscillospiraceae bacterium]